MLRFIVTPHRTDRQGKDLRMAWSIESIEGSATISLAVYPFFIWPGPRRTRTISSNRGKRVGKAHLAVRGS